MHPAAGVQSRNRVRQASEGGLIAVGLATLSALGAGCGLSTNGSGPAVDGGSGLDAGSAVEAGRRDGSVIDGRSPQDAASDITGDRLAADAGSLDACVKKTCASYGATCGAPPDGCGGSLACGACPGGLTCGGGGAYTCGTGPCQPPTCASLGLQCGSWLDGCGNILTCGLNGQCNDSTLLCDPSDGCCELPCPANGCGVFNNLCEYVFCDTCVLPQVCDTTQNQCCAPQTCATAGMCGTGLSDGCHGFIDCLCPGGMTCMSGMCVGPMPDAGGGDVGGTPDAGGD